MGEIARKLPANVAVKKIPRMESNGFGVNANREVTLLDAVDHGNVVKLFLAVCDPCYVYLVMEKCR